MSQLQFESVYEALPAGLLAEAEEISIESGECLTQQYHPAEYIYYLLVGSVEFSIHLGINGDKLPVAAIDKTGAVIGWSGLRSPSRYATTVRATSGCRLLRWPQAEVQAFFQQEPHSAIDFLEHVLETGFDLLRQVRQLLTKSIKQPIAKLNYIYPRFRNRFQLERDIINSWLQDSGLFENLSEQSQSILLDKITLQRCYSGEIVMRAGEEGDTLYILVNGSVNLYYEPEPASAGQGAVFLRSLSSQGQVLNILPSQDTHRQDLTVIANQDSLFCCLTHKALRESSSENLQFGLELKYALLNLLGNQLRSSRAQLINQKYDNEVFNITGILEQAAPQLAVTSALHKVPHLLESRRTQGDAFRCLEMSQTRGSALEKNLAGLCLDILQETKSEWKFYQGLQQVYQSVVDSPLDTSAQQLNRRNAAMFREVFENVRYRIKGEENLPASTGHIFILNHLVSHPYHVLPNHFELSLDTNFVSAMILDKKYADSGVRVVRKGRQDEYAHHNYYSRLGYINVTTDESDPATDTEQGAGQITRFIDEAKGYLHEGRNIVICPEGRSLWSAESPGLFKAGAFLLAASMVPEPYIVPLALANFDKRLRNTRLAAVIKPPFRISERLDVNNKPVLKEFLEQYQSVYRGYVKEAQQLALAD